VYQFPKQYWGNLKEVEKQCSAFISFGFLGKWHGEKFCKKNTKRDNSFFLNWNEYITSYSPSKLEHFKVKLCLSESVYSMGFVEIG
jgi:hypothetical protein